MGVARAGSVLTNWDSGNLLVIGARGMLGTELASALRKRAAATGAVVTAWDVGELDITDSAAVRRSLAALRPSLVVNAAAYTNVDGCESNEAEAEAVNVRGPENLARSCKEIGALLVHFSTDFVFAGDARTPYCEGDATGPLSAYGRTKLDGERAVCDSGCDHLTIRTSWLFGPCGRSFVDAIRDRAKAGEGLRVVNDQTGRPTLVADLVDGVLRLLDAGARGTVHFANTGACTWFDFAREIVRLAGADTDVAAISTDELKRPASRPAYSVLDTSRYETMTGQAPADWRDALERYFRCREVVREASGQ